MVHGFMVYTKHTEMAAFSCGTSHVTTKQCCMYTASMDIQKCAVKKRKEKTLVTLESVMSRAQQVCLRVENSAI